MDIRVPSQCPRCPRLVAFRAENARAYPGYYNGAVPAFGALDASLLIVGLAPGLKGANATGRPFTGDFAGDVLYRALLKFGLAAGQYDKRADDGLTLLRTRITNAVRCVPPANKPLPEEERACRPFLVAEMAAMPNLRTILALGSTAHRSVLSALMLKPARFAFAHGARHALTLVDGRAVQLVDSYHTSRYNIQTRRLTEEMFQQVLESIVRDF